MFVIDSKDRLPGIRQIAYFKAIERFLTEKEDRDYTALLSLLFNKEYKWSIRMDETRAAYVKIAREEFLEKLNLTNEQYDEWSWALCSPPRLLEVLLMLAKQMEDAFGFADEKNIPNWFWMMLSNLGISEYDDRRLGTKEADIINQKLDIWLNRHFEPDGTGSPFPLKGVCLDQRTVDLWQQANLYVTENFQTLIKEWDAHEEE